MNDAILLTIPARQNMMLVARMALAGFGAQCGADVDTLEDIRTACDEACYCLMHQRREALKLHISAEYDGEYAAITFEAERGAVIEGASAHDPEIARGILALLVSEVSVQHDSDGPWQISLRLRPAFPAGGGYDR